MLNEKGLVVSSILYTLLIAFLLFLGVTLSTFQASSRLISNSNKDLINGTKLTATAISLTQASGKTCKRYDGYALATNEHFWFQSFNGDTLVGNQYLIKINSKYGTSYWPRDYGISIDSSGNITGTLTSFKGKVSASCETSNCRMNLSTATNPKITFTDGSSPVEVTLSDFCG